jgi:aryl-alcohol dehydrogenase-like predicted oxidoreductase
MAIEKRAFGRTGHMSSAVIFGAAALKNVDQATADSTLDVLYRYGVNHIDTAPRYGDAELRIGPWMERARDDFFLATKTDQFDYAGCKTQIQQSLERLRTNRIDILQLHCLIHPDDWELALGPDGALKAIQEAKQAGQVDHIGVTGHGWTVAAMHRKSLERFDFDSVLMPWNWFTAHHPTYARDFMDTVALCEERNVAIQTIKTIARGHWAAGVQQNRNTW